MFFPYFKKSIFLLQIIVTFVPAFSWAGSGLEINYKVSVESLKNIETQAKNIISLPLEVQHGEIKDNLDLNGYLWCTSLPNGNSECLITFYESGSKQVDGKFRHYIKMKFDLKSLSQTISFLNWSLNNTPEQQPISKARVFNSDDESAVDCQIDQDTSKRFCRLSLWSEN